MAVPERCHNIGDRVVVMPLSRALADLRGAHGTIERVLREYPLDAGLYVRLDTTGELLAIGEDCVHREEVA